MRVSELAKELGYKAAELVELAKAKGIKVEDARANIDARLAAAVRAQVPHRPVAQPHLRANLLLGRVGPEPQRVVPVRDNRSGVT